MAVRYRNQKQFGSDSEIAAAITQFEMVAETVGTTYVAFSYNCRASVRMM